MFNSTSADFFSPFLFVENTKYQLIFSVLINDSSPNVKYFAHNYHHKTSTIILFPWRLQKEKVLGFILSSCVWIEANWSCVVISAVLNCSPHLLFTSNSQHIDCIGISYNPAGSRGLGCVFVRHLSLWLISQTALLHLFPSAVSPFSSQLSTVCLWGTFIKLWDNGTFFRFHFHFHFHVCFSSLDKIAFIHTHTCYSIKFTSHSSAYKTPVKHGYWISGVVFNGKY